MSSLPSHPACRIARLIHEQASPYIFPMLVLSKRLHSIYVLRMFNDCFAMTGFFIGTYLFQKRHFNYGTIIFSAGMGVKMSLLLAVPAIGPILYQAMGPWNAMLAMSNIGQVQVRAHGT